MRWWRGKRRTDDSIKPIGERIVARLGLGDVGVAGAPHLEQRERATVHLLQAGLLAAHRRRRQPEHVLDLRDELVAREGREAGDEVAGRRGGLRIHRLHHRVGDRHLAPQRLHLDGELGVDGVASAERLDAFDGLVVVGARAIGQRAHDGLDRADRRLAHALGELCALGGVPEGRRAGRRLPCRSARAGGARAAAARTSRRGGNGCGG